MACRTVRPKRELLRVVRGPDGTIAVDPTGRATGRGAYLCRDTACLAKGIEKGALSRALSTRLPADVEETLSSVVTTTQPTITTTLHNDQGGARGQE